MALSNTTLTNAIGAGDLGPFAVASTTGFPAVGVYGSRQVMRIDGETMLVNYVPASGQVAVLARGYDGTVAQPHEALSQVTTSATNSDFNDIGAGYVTNSPVTSPDRLALGVDTTFTASGTPATSTTVPLPLKDTIYNLTKATAAAITLVSGTAANAGVKITFMGTVAAANTVTYTPGFNGDTTSSDVATFATKVGSTLTIQAGPTGLWAVVGQNGITLA